VGDGVLRVFVNMETKAAPLLAAVKAGDIPAGRVVVTYFEDVLGTKMNAWLQATLGTGVKAPLLGG
jgi:hypothetical protein